MVLAVTSLGIFIMYVFYLRSIQDRKNYERGLEMVTLLVQLPPSTEDLSPEGRDMRDVAEEAISQAQIMYSVLATTARRNFRSRIYGQNHISFEIVASQGRIQYYVATPPDLVDVVKQSIIAAYPSAKIGSCEDYNIFNSIGKVAGTTGGTFELRRTMAYSIATYTETKRDAMQLILNALSSLGSEDGAAIQILLRPAPTNWQTAALEEVDHIYHKDSHTGLQLKELVQSLWKPLEAKITPSKQQLTSLERSSIEAIEEKVRHAGFEVSIRVLSASNTAAKSQTILNSIVAAFALFDSSNNGLKFVPMQTVDGLTASFILRIFPQTESKMILNSVELSTILHFPDQRSTPTSQVERQASRQVDGPNQMSDDGILLGYNQFRDVKKEVRLSDADRRRHIYIIGQTGTGKSGLLENLGLQDMLDGKGFAYIDPHGDSAERLLGMVPKERAEDVIYFSPGDMEHPIGLNLFEFETEEQKDFLIQEAIAMLYRLYDPNHVGMIGARYEHWFRNAALTVMSDPSGSSFIDIPQVFSDNNFAKYKLQFVRDQTVLDFWNKEMAQTSDYHKSEVLGWFVSKFGAFLSNEMMRNILGQTKSGFNLRDIMDNKKILLVNLSQGRTGELNSQLLGMILVMKFQAAAMGRANVPEDQRPDFNLYVDEFQNFATDSFEVILSQARKYHLSLTLANQFMTQLDNKVREAVIGNVGTVVSGRLGSTDAEIMAKRFKPVFSEADLTKLPNFEAIASIMIRNVPSAPFSMTLMPPLGKPSSHLAQALKRLSAAKYGQPRLLVGQSILNRLHMQPTDTLPTLNRQTQNVKQDILEQEPTRSLFFTNWLAKRSQRGALNLNTAPTITSARPHAPAFSTVPQPDATEITIKDHVVEKEAEANTGRTGQDADEIFIDLRGNLHHSSSAQK